MEQILKIELNDDGNFYENLVASELSLEANITVMHGMFKKQSKVVFNNILHDKYDLTINDKFYFLPGVTIPRIKLKDISNTHKIRTVRDIDVATHIFIGSKTIDKITDDCWENAVTTVKFKEFIEDAYATGCMQQYYYENVKDALEFYTNDLILITRQTSSLLTNSDIPYNITDEWLEDGSNMFIFLKSDYVDIYNNLIGKELYQEDSLMEYINGPDAVVIDHQMFNTLSDMFNSSDRENWTLSMEIMANCDYKKSLLYLALLFNYQAHKMDTVQSKNHVNFKALTLYMNLPYGLSINADQLVDILINKKAVTKDNMEIVLNHFGEEIVDRGSSNHFKTKSVTFSSEVDALLNEEIIHLTKDDYQVLIPEEIEIPQLVDEIIIQEELIVEPINKINEPDSTAFDTFTF